MKKSRISEKTMKLVLGGIMIALSAVLSLIKVFQLPYGGSITLCSMLPIMIYAYKYGVKWGVFAGFAYSITQLILDAAAIRGFTLLSALGVMVFDFFVAFSVLGLASIFKNRFKKNTVAFSLGAAFAMLLRYLSHVISGMIFFGSYAEWYFSQEGMAIGGVILEKFSGYGLALIYSLIYNGSYMLPELLITLIAGYLLMKLTEKTLFPSNKLLKRSV